MCSEEVHDEVAGILCRPGDPFTCILGSSSHGLTHILSSTSEQWKARKTAEKQGKKEIQGIDISYIIYPIPA